jgi:hypothetical protein
MVVVARVKLLWLKSSLTCMVNPLINFWDVTEGIDSEMERLDWDEER